ncbi:hypothetical protein ACSW9V_15130 (plasmid) [Clostridium perfringens]|uniref:hypothetical protein n=1 Tax=Clostridium perfringens TaxID=1502 RepID=UPI000B3A55DB|nr:hypothetical protein [Clostridium perfringens]EGT0690801.1 hypothetical protein [Clostridium perfringens]EGT0693580.1 hypothetical protein [Clostridium perfringens]EGT0696537.1 hypothetical protein [Clostridium perfringens]MDU3376215.1 hypothetical protein [Clostridium perfringens]MDU3534171.1 hypothetical protein [Clostridium perfringens]
MTNLVNDLFEEDMLSKFKLFESLRKHKLNKSDSCPNDIKSNEIDIKAGTGRVVSKYRISGYDIFIITELGAHTIIMLCEEY